MVQESCLAGLRISSSASTLYLMKTRQPETFLGCRLGRCPRSQRSRRRVEAFFIRIRNVFVRPQQRAAATAATAPEQSWEGQDRPHREAVAAVEELLPCQPEAWCADEGAAGWDDWSLAQSCASLVSEQEVQGQEKDANEAEQGKKVSLEEFLQTFVAII